MAERQCDNTTREKENAMTKHVAGVWGVVVLLVAASAVSVRAADVTGTWTFAVNLGIGSGEPTFVFEQDGETLTGTYEGTFGSANVMGEVKGDMIEFSFAAEGVGKATYTGKIMGDTMQGTCDYGGNLAGTWEAKKES